MTVLADSATIPSISTYEGLKSAIAAWANRTDLSDRLAQFIEISEARFNRRLRVRAMEASFGTTVLSDGAALLPDAFLAFKELRNAGSSTWALEPRPLQWIRDQPARADEPLYFAVMDAEVVCWPTAGSIVGTYYAPVPPLRDNDTNWLLTACPDLYLFAALEQVAVYIRDKSLLDMAAAQTELLLQQIQGADNANAISGGPLQVRVQ